MKWLSCCTALLLGALFTVNNAAAEEVVLRTPDEAFQNLPDFDYEPRYVEVNGLRMAYVESGEGDPILCLHGEPSWSFLYRKMIPGLSDVGRVIAPDLIGFGRSDKLPTMDDYTFKLHYEALETFIEELDLRRITLVCQDWGGVLGLTLAGLHEDRFARLVIMNTGIPVGEGTPSPAFMQWRTMSRGMSDMPIGGLIQRATKTVLTPEIIASYNAPFPDASYKAGAQIFPSLVPITPDDPGVAYTRPAKEHLATWSKPALIMFSDGDPITAGGDTLMRALIPSAKNEPEIVIEGGGHFLQEDKGEEIAQHIVEFIQRRPVE